MNRAAKNAPVSPCLVCGSDRVAPFLDLGETALANKFLREQDLGKPEAVFPLRVGFCPTCHHVQLTERVPPSAMFDDYLYISSVSETLSRHLAELAATVTERFDLGNDDLVVDVGCNDGTLLAAFAGRGVRTLGVDPAANLAPLAAEKGIRVHTGYFGEETARALGAERGPASVITLTNVFPHLPRLDDFMRGADALLAPDGTLVIEAHYLGDILDQLAFDTVYHEHVSYWALGPMAHLFARHGFGIADAERLPIHHGQVRVLVRRGAEPPANVQAILAAEKAAGFGDFKTFQAFAARVAALRHDLSDCLKGLRAEGKRIAAYGAPAKGSTLLSYFGLDTGTVEYIADRSPLKQGTFTPGTHIPVVAPERLMADRPDYLLLLAWNFIDEILAQQAEYRDAGGRFIVPVPKVRIV